VVEDVTLEEDRKPAIERKLAELHIAVIALRHEGVCQHHEKRPDRRDKDDNERRRGEQPPRADIVTLGLSGDLCRCRHAQSFRTWAASSDISMPARSPTSKPDDCDRV